MSHTHQVLAVEGNLPKNGVAQKIAAREIQVIADARKELAENALGELRVRKRAHSHLLLPNELVHDGVDSVHIRPTRQSQMGAKRVKTANDLRAVLSIVPVPHHLLCTVLQ